MPRCPLWHVLSSSSQQSTGVSHLAEASSSQCRLSKAAKARPAHRSAAKLILQVPQVDADEPNLLSKDWKMPLLQVLPGCKHIQDTLQ